MRQNRESNQWHFDTNVHSCVDKHSGPRVSLVVTAANVHVLAPASELRHGDENLFTAMSTTKTLQRDLTWQAPVRSFG